MAEQTEAGKTVPIVLQTETDYQIWIDALGFLMTEGETSTNESVQKNGCRKKAAD